MMTIIRRPALRLAILHIPRLIIPTIRLYHSYDHPSPVRPFNATESKILQSAYKHIPEHGFTTAALSAGACDAGFPEITTAGIADGAFALVRYHLVTKRLALAEKGKTIFKEGEPVGVDERVERLTWERLMENREVIHKWQDALALMAQPSYLPESIKELASLTDEIYFLAGDVSVDPSWYTKRSSLSVIYASTELFMTNDRSPEFDETRHFLNCRLRESSSMSWIMGAVGQYAGFTASAALNVLRSKGMRV